MTDISLRARPRQTTGSEVIPGLLLNVSPKLLIAGGVVYFLLLLVLGFYHTFHGDEAMWTYQAALVREGLLPSYDFFTQEPWAMFAPLSGLFALLGDSIEAARLLMAVMGFAANAMVTALVWRYRGAWAAAAVFSLLALNVDYLATMVTYNSQSPSIFGLVGAWFFILFPRRPDWRHYAVSGLFLGFAIASRLPVALAALMVAAHAVAPHAYADPDAPWQFRRALANLTAATGAALLVCLPDLWIVSLDPERVFFARIVSVNEWIKINRGIEGEGLFSHDPWARLEAYAGYFTHRGYHAVYQNMVFPIAVGAALAIGLAARATRRPLAARDEAGKRSGDLGWTIGFAVMVVAGYSLSWILLPSYYISAFPFFAVITVICGQSALRRARQTGRLAGQAAMAVVAGLLVLHGVQGLAHWAWQVGLRHTASLGQPLSVNRLACWIERATGPDDRILDFYPLNALAAHRRLPLGFEASVQMKNWYALTPESQKLIRAITLNELIALVAEAQVPMVIDNNVASSLTDPFMPNFRNDLERNYVLVGRVGGTVAPQDVWVERRWLDQKQAPLPVLPKDEASRVNLSLLHSDGAASFFWALAEDLSHSARTLPRDIAASLARLVGLGWPARCGDYVMVDVEPPT